MSGRVVAGLARAACFVAAMALSAGCASSDPLLRHNVMSTPYGEVDGEAVRLYTLTNTSGMRARITNYGATVTELWTPDRDGKLADVVLGFDRLEDYRERSPYFGCMAGRCANRIAGGRFEIDGREYALATNNGPNHLHGGVRGFDKVVWDAAVLESDAGPGIRMTYRSPDGEEGYPGNVTVVVDYILTDRNELKVITEAVTDAPTVVNIVHHSYWNLAGHDAGSILDHELMVSADRYTPADETFIPTGEIAPVARTPFDFRELTPMGRNIARVPPANADDPGGYDLNYVVRGDPAALRLAARVKEPRSGRVMEIHADQPGIQFYTGNHLALTGAKGGADYPRHSGFCLETQYFPDAINRRGRPGWPDPVLRPGEKYRHVMVHAFRAE